MKKRVLILSVAAILFASGVALAHGHGYGHYGNRYGNRYDGGRAWDYGYPCQMPFGGQRPGWFAERHPYFQQQQIPSHMQDRLEESRRIMVELRAEMSKASVNKARVLALREQNEKLRKEISDWHFKQWLDNPQTAGPAPERK